MKYIILNTVTLANTRFQEIKSGATTDGQWLPEYDQLTTVIENQITTKGAYAYITGLTSYYTQEEITASTDLSSDWYLLGFRQVIKDISDCPKTGLKRKVFLRHLVIDCGLLQNDLTQPVENQRIKGTYNIVTLALDGTVFSISQDEYVTIGGLSLSQYDYYFGEGIYGAVIAKFNSLFD